MKRGLNKSEQAAMSAAFADIVEECPFYDKIMHVDRWRVESYYISPNMVKMEPKRFVREFINSLR